MRPPPTPAALPRYPVVGGLALLAIGVTLAAETKAADVSALVEGPQVAHGEPWRLVTSILPHVGLLHLLFNCYWLWAFGTLVEETFGHLRTFGLVLLLAVGSGAAEYAFLDGGVGLSGVGYGLFAMLWVLSRRRDPRFYRVIDGQTAAVFAGWFFICIVLTATGQMAVANIAHGAGAVLGAGVGLAAGFRRWRVPAAAAVAVVVVAACVGATVGRPYLNVSRNRGIDEAKLGYDALERNDNGQAAAWLERSVAMRRKDPSSWFNLGLAYYRLGRLKEATDAYRRATELDPQDAKYRRALDDLARPGHD